MNLCVLFSSFLNTHLLIHVFYRSRNTNLNCCFCVIENKSKYLLWLKFLVLHGLLWLAKLFWLDQHLDSSLRHQDPSLIRNKHSTNINVWPKNWCISAFWVFVTIYRQCYELQSFRLAPGRTNLRVSLYRKGMKSEKIPHYAPLMRIII